MAVMVIIVIWKRLEAMIFFCGADVVYTGDWLVIEAVVMIVVVVVVVMVSNCGSIDCGDGT